MRGHAAPGRIGLTRSDSRPLRAWIANLPAVLVFTSVVMRAGLTYRGRPQLIPVLAVLALWLALLLAEPAIHQRWPRITVGYLALQAAPPFLMIGAPNLGHNDFVAVLFAILSMEAMRRLVPHQGAVVIALLSLLPVARILRLYGPAESVGAILVYTGANAFLGTYALANRRADEARTQNEDLAREVEDANRQLRQALTRREQLAVARARHRLARELHDSVTQTVFSMTLATESAMLLLERDPGRVAPQLDHLTGLSRSALAQIQTLIYELRPEAVAPGGLAAALRHNLAERRLSDSLTYSVEVEGEDLLLPAEERGLYAIAREAVNNIVKHAQATKACIRLHLEEPFWMEVNDDGRGFVISAAAQSDGVGLVGIGELATEIGWELTLRSAPGEGTSLRVARKASEERPA
jgi:signal transduction histidine kinase